MSRIWEDILFIERKRIETDMKKWGLVNRKEDIVSK